jgi:site-specific recombinase XerD
VGKRLDTPQERVRSPILRKRSKLKLKRPPQWVLRLPDLDHAKHSVLHTLGSSESERTYRFAIDDFIAWYCSEPRIAFNKTVVLRYRFQLEAQRLAPATVSLRLAAVRRLAYEAVDVGLLSPDLAASIQRVKGAKRLGVRLGNWLTAEQAKAWLQCPDRNTISGQRDYTILAVLLGCGLRRSEAARLTLQHFEQRDEHWAIVDLFGKGGHVRSVPVPAWVKRAVDRWTEAAPITSDRLFRCVTKLGTVWGGVITDEVIWHVVRKYALQVSLGHLAPHDLRRTCARLCHVAGGELEQIQFLLGHVSVQTTEQDLGCKQRFRSAANHYIGIEPEDG